MWENLAVEARRIVSALAGLVEARSMDIDIIISRQETWPCTGILDFKNKSPITQDFLRGQRHTC